MCVCFFKGVLHKKNRQSPDWRIDSALPLVKINRVSVSVTPNRITQSVSVTE